MKKIYGYAFASALMALASCSSDAPEIVDGPVLDGEAGYINLSLKGVSAATRGESDVNDVKFFLYKGNSAINYTQVEKNGNTVIVKVNDVPDNVIAVVNSSADYNATLSNPDGFYAKTNTPVMSSAVRYASNGTESYRTSISNANLFKSVESAKAATDAQKITVNVDRTVAKVSVAVNEGVEDEDGYVALDKSFDGYTIKFVIDAVYVNGVATTTPIKRALSPLSNGALSIQGGDPIALANLQGATGSAFWSNTGFGWENTKHFAMTDDNVKGKSQDEIQIFENCPTTANGHTRDYTHVVVAGHYVLSGANAPAENADFWTFGVKDGKPVVYTSEAAVKKAMGGTESSVFHAVYADGGDGSNGRNAVAFYIDNNPAITCVKYGKGCVYYAAAIENVQGVGDAAIKYGKGIVRNHAYVINVSGISGLGVAVPDPNQPIIPEDPDKDNGEYFMSLQIKVNEFVKVADQDINWE